MYTPPRTHPKSARRGRGAYRRRVTAYTRGRAGDVLLRGGVVADGSATTPAPADVLVRGTSITAVEPPGTIPGDTYEVRDLDGLVLSPGFVDVHSHADNAPLLDEDDTTKILQGVTTEVVGNCGFSLAPAAAQRRDELATLVGRIFPPLPWDWWSFGELMSRLDESGHVTNYAPLVGHGTLRVALAGIDDRPLTADERARMGDLASAAIDAGAFGVSTGLIYPPGMFGGTDEIVDVVGRLPEDAVYATHMRGEGAHLGASVAEAIEIGRRTGRRVQVSHLKASGRENWGGVGAALEQLAAARASGIRISQDVYPYIASSTMLTACLPPWFQDGGDRAVLERLDSPDALARLRAELGPESPGDWESHVAGADWQGILVSSTASHRYEGQTLAELADRLGVEPFDALVTLLRDERLQASMVVFSMCEDDLAEVLLDPHSMIGSDGLPPGVGGRPHPRLFGTFPRVLGRYVRERGLLDLGTAVHKMTGLPAATFGLTDRGRVVPGAVADLVAFDAGLVSDRGDYRDPVHPPAGIAWVMQAGAIVVRDEKWLGTRRGVRLTR